MYHAVAPGMPARRIASPYKKLMIVCWASSAVWNAVRSRAWMEASSTESARPRWPRLCYAPPLCSAGIHEYLVSAANMKVTVARDRLVPSVNRMAEELADVRSTLNAQVDCASCLVRQMEVAGRLLARGRTQARLLRETLIKTRELSEAVCRQRALLSEVRQRLKAILAESAPRSRQPAD
jgi:hypothetical protein